MKLEFMHTCATIDSAISETKDLITTMIDSAVEEACPILTQEQLDACVATQMERTFRYVEQQFEECRNININMRESADAQIDNLNDELLEAQAELRVRSC